MLVWNYSHKSYYAAYNENLVIEKMHELNLQRGDNIMEKEKVIKIWQSGLWEAVWHFC